MASKNQRKKVNKQVAASYRRQAERRRARNKFVAMIAVLALVLLAIGSVALGVSGSGSSSTTTTAAAPTTAPTTTTTAVDLGGDDIKGNTPCPAADGSSKRAKSFEKAPPMCIDPAKKYTATFDTNQGPIVATLDASKTPKTTNNFVVLARYHYYDGTQIFRIATSIDIIQGGSPHTETNSDTGPGYTIDDEGKDYKYTAGDLVMARTQEANSASAQFFFATGDAVSGLNAGGAPGTGTYVPFGHASDLATLQKIKALSVPATSPSGDDSFSQTVTINSVKITES